MSPTVALTGATGFIGSAIAKQLLGAGWQVRVLRRPSSDTSRLTGLSLEYISGSLDDFNSLQLLVQGVDAIVHCAGTTRGTTHRHFRQVNVDGVTQLIQAINNQHALPRFLLISSLAAREPDLSPYAASKREGELVLAETARGISWCVLRPPAVYGPGDREILPFFKLMARGIAVVLGPKNARFSLLYVLDLAEAVVQWLGNCSSTSRIFELHDGQPDGYTWNDVIRTMARVRGRRILRLTVPPSVLTLSAMLNQLTAKATGTLPILTPGKVRELRHPNWVCDNTALTEITGWEPKTLLDKGLRQTLAIEA